MKHFYFTLASLIALISITQALDTTNDSKLRSKRRVEDVEKLMRKDEMMKMLICEMCVAESCEFDYCTYCHECAVDVDSNDVDFEPQQQLDRNELQQQKRNPHRYGGKSRKYRFGGRN